MQVEKEAELPRPAPTGSVDLTVKPNDGLNQVSTRAVCSSIEK